MKLLVVSRVINKNSSRFNLNIFFIYRSISKPLKRMFKVGSPILN